MERKWLVLFFPTLCLFSQCRAHLEGFRICFKETERSSQCQGPSYTCSGHSPTLSAWSYPFRDDTDNRGGGCRYQWRVEAGNSIPHYREYRLCFRETEGSSQCQAIRNSCTGWSTKPSWTRPFRDDTDNRAGGCRYSWMIQSRFSYNAKIEVCRVCFKETEGSSQCQGTRQTCSGWSLPGANPSWTLPFRDDTDNRSGGCNYQWYLDCTSKQSALFCPRDNPCR